MSLALTEPQVIVDQIVTFLRQVFAEQHKTMGVIAVSGGIDSALALTLLTRALGPEQVTAVLLPFADQSMTDAELMVEFNQLPAANIHQLNIQPLLESALSLLAVQPTDNVRRGNIMARCRMIAVYDLAKKMEGLVCGTENKSEHYLGYFTRFGDAASDIEPLSNIYKTQVRQLAEFLKLPASILTKAPSAGLWPGQTDEQEMGFSYEQADQVLEQLIDQKVSVGNISLPHLDQAVIQKITNQVQQMAFKYQVPYVQTHN